MNITTIVLANGEEIVGRFKEETETSITLEKPVRIILNPKGIAFAPTCISISDASEFTFSKDHVLYSGNTRHEIADHYIQASTGIQLTSSL